MQSKLGHHRLRSGQPDSYRRAKVSSEFAQTSSQLSDCFDKLIIFIQSHLFGYLSPIAQVEFNFQPPNCTIFN